MDQARPLDVRVTLDLLNLEIGTYSLEPLVSISVNDVTERSIQPATITVIITEAMTTTEGITGTLPVTETSLYHSPLTTAAGSAVQNCLSGSPFCMLALIPIPFAILNKREEIA